MNQMKDMITVGKVSSVYGVKGWVKIYSYTEPMDRILDYQDWVLELNGQFRSIAVDKGRSHGKGMVAHIVGCDDREEAALLNGALIHVSKDQLPQLDEGEFYWAQLEGLRVKTLDDQDLGVIKSMMRAGAANDVMVIQGDSLAVDREERLVPYLPERVVMEVNIEAGWVRVDWQPDY